jgi:alpha-ribazole phosphatase
LLKSGHAILLVRHGETVSNIEGRYHGRLDSPLTERGVAQAQAIGRRLRLLPDARAAPDASAAGSGNDQFCGRGGAARCVPAASHSCFHH